MVLRTYKKEDPFKHIRKDQHRPGTSFNSKKDYKRSILKQEVQKIIKEEGYDN